VPGQINFLSIGKITILTLVVSYSVMYSLHMPGYVILQRIGISTMFTLVLISAMAKHSFHMASQINFVSCGIITILAFVVFDSLMNSIHMKFQALFVV
jgi:hypothetical protein